MLYTVRLFYESVSQKAVNQYNYFILVFCVELHKIADVQSFHNIMALKKSGIFCQHMHMTLFGCCWHIYLSYYLLTFVKKNDHVL